MKKFGPKPRCKFDGCNKVASYNIPDELHIYPEYCEIHRTIDMSNFTRRKCRYLNENNEQCVKKSTYAYSNYPDIFVSCSKHRIINMIRCDFYFLMTSKSIKLNKLSFFT